MIDWFHRNQMLWLIPRLHPRGQWSWWMGFSLFSSVPSCKKSTWARPWSLSLPFSPIFFNLKLYNLKTPESASHWAKEIKFFFFSIEHTLHYVVWTACFIKYCDTLLAHALSSSFWLNLRALRNIWQKLE